MRPARADRRGIVNLVGWRGMAHGRVLARLRRGGKALRRTRVERLELRGHHALAPCLRAQRVFDAARAHAAEHQDNFVFVFDAQHELGMAVRVETEQRDNHAAKSDCFNLRAPRRNDAPCPRLPRQRTLGWGTRRQSRHAPSVGRIFSAAGAGLIEKMARLAAPLPEGSGGKGVRRLWSTTSGAHIEATRNHARSGLLSPLPLAILGGLKIYVFPRT